MKTCLLLTPSIAIALVWSTSVFAGEPPGFDPLIGAEILNLTSADDSTESVELDFEFPFDGVGHTTVWVGTNGCLQLSTQGADGNIDYRNWIFFEKFYDDTSPNICPLNTDFDLSVEGSIHFKQSTNRAVFTWNQVGTHIAQEQLSTFQVQLFSDGTILFAYKGVLDNSGEDFLTSLGQGIVVGISLSDGTFPTPQLNDFDLTAATSFQGGTTIYQRWCYENDDSCGEGGSNDGYAGPNNAEFDLGFRVVTFTPVAGGFEVEGYALPPPPAPPIWESAFGEILVALSGGDDTKTEVTLTGLAFPFEGVSYSTVWVGTNGCLQLGTLGFDGTIGRDLWRSFSKFYNDGDGVGSAEPMICPLATNHDLSSEGEVHLSELPDRAVFTWNEVGSNSGETHSSTFQVQLIDDGTIVFGYQGIYDNTGEGLDVSLDEGIVVGISLSEGDFGSPQLNPFDLSSSTSFSEGDTIFERWCFDVADSCGDFEVNEGWEGPVNTTFDLESRNVVFSPLPNGGFGYSATRPLFFDGFESGDLSAWTP